MAEFPANLRELAKEIAAFATSNAGMILIGITDDGEICGIANVESVDQRDFLLKQVQNICNGAVRPAITPKARFAVTNGKTVLVLTIPRGRQPVYYSHKIPYLRHITESRYAQPHEIVERVREWLEESATTPVDDDDTVEQGQLVSDLAGILVEVLIYGDEAEYREINPWLDMWLAHYGQVARELRDMAATDTAVGMQLDERLREVANGLEEVTTFTFYLGYGSEFSDLLDRVLTQVRKLKADVIDSKPLSQESLQEVQPVVARCARQLTDLNNRAETMAYDGRLEELSGEAAEIGHTLLRLAYYNVDAVADGLSERLKEIGRGLHLLETAELLIDGGTSIEKTVGRISELAQLLTNLTADLEMPDSA